MQNKYLFRFLVLLLLSFVFINSCRKETSSWDVDVLAPLVNSTLNVNNLIPDSILVQNTDNSLDLVFISSISSLAANTMFVFPDTSIDTSYSSPFQFMIPGGSTITSSTIEHAVLEGGVELTYGIIRSGNMQLSVTSSIKGKLDFSFNIPGLKDPSENIFQTVVPVPAGTASAAGTVNRVFDLAGYSMNLTGPDGTRVNSLEINYSAIINETDSVMIEPGDSIRFAFSLHDIVPQYAKGFFGDTTTTDPDSASFSLFRHVISGTMNLEDIDIKLVFENNMGADAFVSIDELYSVNSKTGNTVSLSHPIIGTPVNITRALDNNGIISPTTYSVALGSFNSNIKQFIENLPDSFKSVITHQMNPMGNVSGYNDFGYYEKPMKIDFDIRMPLSMIANNLTMGDTVNFQLNANTENINDGTIYAYFENGFPFTAQVQLYLMDDNFLILDSLINFPNTIAAPPLNASYICTGKKGTKLTIPANADKLALLRAAKKMYIKIKYNTAAQPNYVKIYSFYETKVKVVGDFNYSIGKK